MGKGTGVWVGEHFVTGTILSPSPKGSAQLLFTTSTTKPREVEEPPRGHTGLLTPCPVLFPQCLQLWLHARTLISAGAQVSLGEKAAATCPKTKGADVVYSAGDLVRSCNSVSG